MTDMHANTVQLVHTSLCKYTMILIYVLMYKRNVYYTHVANYRAAQNYNGRTLKF